MVLFSCLKKDFINYIDKGIISNKVYDAYKNTFNKKTKLNQIKAWANSLPFMKEILKDLLEYLNKNKINALFTIPVRRYPLQHIQYLNSAVDIIEQSGYKVINFNKIDDLNIDFDKDLYNSAHLNVYGATKYTLYFSKYLKDNYNLKDHRKNEKDSSWLNEYERFKTEFNNLTKKNFEDLI